MESILNSNYTIIFCQLFLSLFLGAILGIERNFAKKIAGMRTYALVSMGSALFIITSQLVINASYISNINFDPMRLAAGVITGVGFLGAGLIFFKEDKLWGLTTAAGLWVSSGIGIAVGFKLYILAIMATILTLFIFTVLWKFETKIVGNTGDIKEKKEEQDNKN